MGEKKRTTESVRNEGYCQEHQHMFIGSTRKMGERKKEKHMLKNNGPKLLQFAVKQFIHKYCSTNSRQSILEVMAQI
jgi:hypothetical protein